MTHQITPGRIPANPTPEGDGVLVGEGLVQLDAFIDFLCPFCKRFELSAGSVLAALVAERRLTIAYHPMNFLDEASTTQYSTRAAASSGCAADQGRYVEYAHALFVSQPPEGSAGLGDADLIELAGTAGLDGAAFATCVSGGTYLDWPPYVTERAVAAGVTSTPTVLVAGVPVSPHPRVISRAVDRVAARAPDA
jgi:protein-disulfide isomerase